MKKSASRESESSTQFDSPHSPLRFRPSPLSDGGDPHESESPPLRFHSPENSPENQYRDNSKAIVVVGSPAQRSPLPSSTLPDSDRRGAARENAPPVVVINRAVREEPPPPATNLDSAAHQGAGREDGGRGRWRGPPPPPQSRPAEMVKKAALGFRLSEVVLCLISFSVMAADKTQGWSGDSFDRYKEYRFLVFFPPFIGFEILAYDISYFAF